MSNTTDPTTYHTAGKTITSDAGVILNDPAIPVSSSATITTLQSAHDAAIARVNPTPLQFPALADSDVQRIYITGTDQAAFGPADQNSVSSGQYVIPAGEQNFVATGDTAEPVLGGTPPKANS